MTPGGKGAVVWVTGLPASGKSTFARALYDQLALAGVRVKLLDGDQVRAQLMPDLGYGEAARDAFYGALARMAADIARLGYVAVVAATAHERRFRDRAREQAPRFVEVYVATPLDECRRRDVKGLYAAADEGRIADLPGVGVPYEPPVEPDVVAHGGYDADAVAAAAQLVIQARRATMSNEQDKRFTAVVAYDFSDLAELALEQAVAAALNHAHADLHVVAVLEEGMRATYETAERMQQEATKLADRRIPKPTPTDLRLFVHARIGHPAQEILALASEAAADVIVLGTHGRSGLKRWLMGSVAEKVVRHAGCPVLVMRPKTYTHDPAEDAAFAPEPPCPACVKVRAESGGKTWWCEEHGKPHEPPHTYHYRATTSADVSDHSGSILW